MQFNTEDYLRKIFTFSSSLFEFKVDPNTNMSILIDDPCVTNNTGIGSVNINFDIWEKTGRNFSQQLIISLK